MALKTLDVRESEPQRSTLFATTMPTPRDSALVTLVLVIVLTVFGIAIGSAHFRDDDTPQGETMAQIVDCWNQAGRYEGAGRLVWDFENGECVAIK